MGIKGLFSFIQNIGEDALKWHKLQNCKLVIDGNNLAYAIYTETVSLNKCYGGDYNEYSEEVVKFFKKLNMCNVETYILTDGGHPRYRAKFRTINDRVKNQISACHTINPDNQYSKYVFPIMGLSVFANAAQKCGVKVLRCDFEADDDIVVVAKKLGAYVLSNDSDFYVSDVPFILLNTLNMESIQTEENKSGEISRFIPCYLFSPEIFTEITGVPKRLFPLLAPLLGNDIVPKLPIEHIYSKLKPKSSKLKDSYKHILSVLKWLSKQSPKASPEEILNYMLSETKVPKDQRANYKEVLVTYFPTKSTLETWISDHIDNCPLATADEEVRKSTYYCFSNIPFDSDCYLPLKVKEQIKCQCPDRAICDLMYELPLPQWFVLAYRSSLIEPMVTNIWNKNFFFTIPMIENCNFESIYCKLEYLFVAIRAILWRSVTESHRLKNMSKNEELVSNDAENLLNHYAEEGDSCSSSDECTYELQCLKLEDSVDDAKKMIDSSSNGALPDNCIPRTQLDDNLALNNEVNSKPTNKPKPPGTKKRKVKLSESHNVRSFIKTGRIPCMNWFIRKDLSMVPCQLRKVHIDRFPHCPTLFTVSDLSTEEKRNHFYAITKHELIFEEGLPANLEFILFIICFWYLTYSNPKINKSLLSLIMCIVMFYVIDGKHGRKRSYKHFQSINEESEKLDKMLSSGSLSDPSTLTVLELIKSLTKEEISCARFSLHKFHLKDLRDTRHTHNKSIVHSFGQFQASYFFLTNLNGLLNFPYPSICIESFISGTFFYNVHKAYDKDIDVALTSLFGANNRIKYLCRRLYSIVGKYLSIPKLGEETESTGGSMKAFIHEKKKSFGMIQTKRKKKTPKKKKVIVENVPSDSSDSEDQDLTEEELKVLANNPFSQLLLAP